MAENNRFNNINYAIDQYVNALIYQQMNYGYINSYSALISLSAIDISYKGNNERNEEIFLQNMSRHVYGKKASVEHIQKNNNGTPVFYHISTNGCKSADYRIYLNCEPQYVALLADAFARVFGDESYYFKFNSNQSNSRRSEQFVFYVASDDLNNVCQKIQLTHSKYPGLFKGSENINPFLKSIDGYIAYAPEVHSGQYISLDNRCRKIDCSYNTLLSKALEDSTLYAVRAISSVDFELIQKIHGNYYTSLSPYVISGILKDIEYGDPARKQQLFDSIKLNLAILKSRNPELDIPNLPEINRRYNSSHSQEQNNFRGNR